MAHISFSQHERDRMQAVENELEEIMHELFSDLRGQLTPDDLALVICYARSCVRRALEIGTLLHSVVDAQRSGGSAYPGRGRESFVRAGLAAWKDSFAPVEDVWRLCPVFDNVEGGERRVLADISTLEVMAANRMFTSIDDQYEEFFASDG